MRAFVICFAMTLALINLVPSSSRAEIGSVSRYHYDTCSCQYGYPGRACVAAVACTSSGGRCAAKCQAE